MDPSDLAASMSWYRVVLDVATTILVVGLIGEYWRQIVAVVDALFKREWRVAWTKFVAIIFPMMVVLGVAGELWVQFRVSALEDQWERVQLPRVLSLAQQQSIAEKIKPFKGTNFVLAFTQELEPMRLLDKVEDALTIGGWKESPTVSGLPTFNRMNRSVVGTRTVAGVWLVIHADDSTNVKDAAMALRTALDSEQLFGSFVSLKNPTPELASETVHVWVGAKP